MWDYLFPSIKTFRFQYLCHANSGWRNKRRTNGEESGERASCSIGDNVIIRTLREAYCVNGIWCLLLNDFNLVLLSYVFFFFSWTVSNGLHNLFLIRELFPSSYTLFTSAFMFGNFNSISWVSTLIALKISWFLVVDSTQWMYDLFHFVWLIFRFSSIFLRTLFCFYSELAMESRWRCAHGNRFSFLIFSVSLLHYKNLIRQTRVNYYTHACRKATEWE